MVTVSDTSPEEPNPALAEFVGGDNEENAVATTAGEESHEDPWKFADLDGLNSPPIDPDGGVE